MPSPSQPGAAGPTEAVAPAGFHRWLLEKLLESWEVDFVPLLIVSLLPGSVKAGVLLELFRWGWVRAGLSSGLLPYAVFTEEGDTVLGHSPMVPLWASSSGPASLLFTEGAPRALLGALQCCVGLCVQILFENLSSCRIDDVCLFFLSDSRTT